MLWLLFTLYIHLLYVTAPALLVIHNFACPNPCFNLLHSTRQAVTNTVLRGPFTYATSDKEYAKAQFLTCDSDREQFRRGAHLLLLGIF